MAKVLFFTATEAQFNALGTKDSNALYFITDKNRIYKGDSPFTHPVELVTDFPASGVVGTLYIHTATHEAKTWNGTAWTNALPPVTTAIGAEAGNDQIPSALAVKNYVDGQISGVNSTVGGVVSNVAYVEGTKSLSVTKGESVPVVTQLSGFLDGASYNGSTGALTFTTNGGTPITVNLPVEQFLSAASYSDQTNILTLTLNDDTEFEVNLADLVNVYEGGQSGSIDVTVAGGAITASVRVSATAGNQLTVNADGLYVPVTDISGKMDKVAGTADTVLLGDANGAAVRSSKTVGGATLAVTPEANTLATEAAVATALSWQTL